MENMYWEFGFTVFGLISLGGIVVIAVVAAYCKKVGRNNKSTLD